MTTRGSMVAIEGSSADEKIPRSRSVSISPRVDARGGAILSEG